MMRVDQYIELIIKELTIQGQGKNSALKSVYEGLSKRYRSTNENGFQSKLEMIAYIHARFPATYSVVCHILHNEIPKKEEIRSILDLGAGPGTATLAALTHFHLSHATLIEQTPELIAASQSILAPHFSECDFIFNSASVQSATFSQVDLVILSYLLTEMSEDKALNVYEASLKATKMYNLVVLPGTSAAFKLLLQLRNCAIALGYHVLAPCPHTQTCPVADKVDQWCHFRQRLDRSSAHQHIKKGTMGYEDEPYCYLLVTPFKDEYTCMRGRVINRPRYRSGHIYVDVCAELGIIETKCVTKKDKIEYKMAKNLSWGTRI